MCVENENNGYPFCGGRLNIGEPANEFGAILHLRAGDYEMEALRAGETGVDGAICWITSEVPEVNCAEL